MGNPVFANDMEISSKSMGGKSICEFPDTCFTPPQTPGTPPGVPLPYPNTGMASDTSDGSRSVKIGGSEVMLKNKSAFKKSTGDEAGCAPKKGLINSQNRGKVYFIAWSMDVKIEGENVVRNLDMTTHNHACDPANGSVPCPHVAQQDLKEFDKCKDDRKKIKDNCEDDGSDQCPGHLAAPVGEQRDLYNPPKGDGPSRTEQAGTQATADAESSKCAQAMRCFLRPHSPTKDEQGCCPGQTPHHIPPTSCIKNSSGNYPSGYKYGNAPCVCLEGANQYVGSHGMNHSAIDHLAETKLTSTTGKPVKDGSKCSLEDYNKACAAAVAQQCDCSPGCIEEQLNKNENFKNVDTVTHKKIGSDQLSAGEKQKLNAEFDAMPKRRRGR
jgi:uncharacterized protein DUF4150/HNH/endonuclease VII toxin of polymorphic toxin system